MKNIKISKLAGEGFTVNRCFRNVFFAVLGLLLISCLVCIWLPPGQAFRIVFGSFYVLFLPGWALTLAFLQRSEIDIVERITLSFALSISIVPLLVFYLNLIGMKITLVNIVLIVLAVILLSSLAKRYCVKR